MHYKSHLHLYELMDHNMTYRIAEAIIYATKYCFFLVIISKTPTTIDTIQNRIKSKLDNFITPSCDKRYICPISFFSSQL